METAEYLNTRRSLSDWKSLFLSIKIYALKGNRMLKHPVNMKKDIVYLVCYGSNLHSLYLKLHAWN